MFEGVLSEGLIFVICNSVFTVMCRCWSRFVFFVRRLFSLTFLFRPLQARVCNSLPLKLARRSFMFICYSFRKLSHFCYGNVFDF